MASRGIPQIKAEIGQIPHSDRNVNYLKVNIHKLWLKCFFRKRYWVLTNFLYDRNIWVLYVGTEANNKRQLHKINIFLNLSLPAFNNLIQFTNYFPLKFNVRYLGTSTIIVPLKQSVLREQNEPRFISGQKLSPQQNSPKLLRKILRC